MARPTSDDDLKLYYAIGEVAELLEVNTSQLRFWETEFKHIKPSKNSRGERRFTKENIQQLRQVHHLLKVRGFTIEGAKREIASAKNLPTDKQQAIDRLQVVRSRLKRLLQEDQS